MSLSIDRRQLLLGGSALFLAPMAGITRLHARDEDQKMGMIEGHFDERFSAVRDAFVQNFADGLEVGASVCVTLEGQVVVDLWGGHADEARTTPWAENTVVTTYSTTKTMMALVALMLADRGELDFSAPVSRYWPEFAQNGKEGVLVSHCMSHTAGLPGWDEELEIETLYDWDRVTGLLAAQAPWWEPGTASGYHAVTQGFLVGEVVRRITGKTLGTVFREEIAGPLGADFHIGTTPDVDARVGELIPIPAEVFEEAPRPEPDSIPARVYGSVPLQGSLYTRTKEWQRAEIPAANGIGNARSVARVQAVMANGGSAFGTRILSEQGTRTALQEQISGIDLVFGTPARFGMGYGLPNETTPFPNPNTIFWGGFGGSSIVVDFDKRMTYSYVMNKMAFGDENVRRRTNPLLSAIYNSLEAL